MNWWGFTPQPIAAEQYIAAFNEEYPDIEVTFRQLPIDGYDAALRPALSSNAGPDVFAVAPGGGIASVALYGNNAIDLTDAITESLGDDWESQVSATGVEPLTVDGELRALSIGSTFAGNLWINQDLFDEFDLEVPTTLDEWKDACDTFRAGGQGCFIQGAGQVAFNQDTLQSIADSVKPGVWTAASRGEASWDDPAIVEALTIWKDLFDSGIMADGALGLQQYPDASNAFLGGQYAMVQMGTWYMQYATAAGAAEAVGASGVTGAEPFTMLAAPFPDVAGNGNPAQMFGDSDWGLAVSSRSRNQAAATTFATWLTTSVAGQQLVANILNDIPALGGIQPQWDEIELVNPDVQSANLQELIERTTTVSEPRLSLVSSELQEAIGVASTTVASGDATPEEAAATLQATMGG
ncbi:hypothetical protein GCM10009775_09790 [Microbacterium aoyamense]|uniref:ABC transporter substrate-binding protein n=1 Tax=Microbacterium aoyamense TaxID=344166 RepID=A0ABN2PEA2_9MICO|nr:extracellular solute-binding protein [Microbacterium aoyamense]